MKRQTPASSKRRGTSGSLKKLLSSRNNAISIASAPPTATQSMLESMLVSSSSNNDGGGDKRGMKKKKSVKKQSKVSYSASNSISKRGRIVSSRLHSATSLTTPIPSTNSIWSKVKESTSLSTSSATNRKRNFEENLDDLSDIVPKSSKMSDGKKLHSVKTRNILSKPSKVSEQVQIPAPSSFHHSTHQSTGRKYSNKSFGIDNSTSSKTSEYLNIPDDHHSEKKLKSTVTLNLPIQHGKKKLVTYRPARSVNKVDNNEPLSSETITSTAAGSSQSSYHSPLHLDHQLGKEQNSTITLNLPVQHPKKNVVAYRSPLLVNKGNNSEPTSSLSSQYSCHTRPLHLSEDTHDDSGIEIQRIHNPHELLPPIPQPTSRKEKENDAIAPSSKPENTGKDTFIVKPNTFQLPPQKNGNIHSKPKVNNDNFVRLNLRNNAGSCRGVRKKPKSQNDWNRKHLRHDTASSISNVAKTSNGDDNVSQNETSQPTNYYKERQKSQSVHAVVDHMDDYLDGRFQSASSSSLSSATTKDSKDRKNGSLRKECVPTCSRHSRPCKLLTVKKGNTGNKGRKFYVCGMPRGEQCDFFQWQDYTIETVKSALSSSSNSNFIARQVNAYTKRFRELTLPELRQEAKKRGLRVTGKKDVILLRLSIWVRDEISHSVKYDDEDGFKDENKENDNRRYDSTVELEETMDDSRSDISSESCESDDEDELEILDEPNIGVGNTEIGSPTKRLKHNGTSSVFQLLKGLFGYSKFREGQEWAVQRCLAQKKTLLVAPTGMGKSLCYILPAALMEGVCVVVSPLIALIEDQLRQMPPRIPAATLSGNLSAKEMAIITDDLIKRRIKILFVSPERLSSAAFRRLLRKRYNPTTEKYERQLPPVSILCVDEAHCLSHWGHNFRPSYLRLQSLLEAIEAQSILALTATAGPRVVSDICRTLQIPSKNLQDDNTNEDCKEYEGVKVLDSNRDNIDVSVSFLVDTNERLHTLYKLLTDTKDCRFKGESIIVYVWRQKDAEIISEQLNGMGIKGGVVCYHGGMDSQTRYKAQGKFLRGKARICVATVAFGLGINKPDIRGVIHMCLPSSLETYLQEIGRAGRDGKLAQAVTLITPDELHIKHSLCFSDKISLSQIKALLYILRDQFREACLHINNDKTLNIIDVALPLDSAIATTDCKSETIQTILSILENDMFSIEGIIPDSVSLTLKKRTIEKLSDMEDVARCIKICGKRADIDMKDSNGFSKNGGTAMERGFTMYSFGVFQFSIMHCVHLLGPNAEPRHVFAALRRLETAGELEVKFSKVKGNAIHLKINQKGINYLRESCNENIQIHDLSSNLQSLATDIINHFNKQVEDRSQKVLDTYHILKKVAGMNDEEELFAKGDIKLKTTKQPEEKGISKRLHAFQTMVSQYFEHGKVATLQCDDQSSAIKCMDQSDTQLILLSADINSLLKDQSLVDSAPSSDKLQFGNIENIDYTSLCITKILHGIESPRVPLLQWYRHLHWGKWRHVQFISLLDTVEDIISEYFQNDFNK